VTDTKEEEVIVVLKAAGYLNRINNLFHHEVPTAQVWA
jgi:hypothetical protein